VFKTALDDAADPSPLARLLLGVICPIPKPGRPQDELDYLRPVTLLNCDVMLLMLVMSSRLQRPLEFLIEVTQSAFLVGRDISDNVQGYLYNTMATMGFQRQGVIRRLLAEWHAVLRPHQWLPLSPLFPVNNSLAQGTSVSCQ
jgi:hypothetical protein